MLRLFVCVWVPDKLKERIVKLQKEIMEIPIKGKLVEEKNFHLTITFLGNVKEDEVDSIKKKLDLVTKNIKKFKISLSGLKVIPNESYVRVLGINVKDSEKIINLIRIIGKEIGGKYHEMTKLTLCRVKNVEDKRMLKSFIEKNRNVEIGGFEIENISLVKSILTKSGPLYKIVHKSELQ